MGGAKKCEVCEEAQSKYKCPTCLKPYCSLGCFKRHKEIPCVKQVAPSEGKLTSSSEILDALKNEKLQKLIIDIDSSADAENELDKAMEVEEFRLFTDKILSTISP